MELNKQPLRGLIPLIIVIISSLLFIYIFEYVLDIPPGEQAIYALFFVWMAFVVSLIGKWPLTKVKQPLVGFAFLTASLLLGIFHPIIMDWLGYDWLVWSWPLISNLFLGVGIVVAFGNMFVEGLKQPASIAMNSLFMYIFAIVLLLWVGFVPAIWFAFFVYVIFWMDGWPVTNMKQPQKGIMLFVIMGFFALVLWYLFIQVGTHFFEAEGGLWFVIWVWWLVLSSWVFETWPIQKLKQPLKAIVALVITVALTFVTYYLIVDVFAVSLAVAGSYVWVFVAWLYSWDILFGKWPADRPKKEVSAQK